MKRQPLELVRLGQGSVRHVCLPPDWILKSLLESMNLDDGGVGSSGISHPDARFLQQHRALCGRYGVPNMEPVHVGRKTYDPVHMRVCALCAYALAEVRLGGNAAPFDLALRRAVRVLNERLDPKGRTK